MNTQYTQYINAARTTQYQHERQQDAATLRALHTTRQEQQAQRIAESRPSSSRRLLRALAALL